MLYGLVRPRNAEYVRCPLVSIALPEVFSSRSDWLLMNSDRPQLLLSRLAKFTMSTVNCAVCPRTTCRSCARRTSIRLLHGSRHEFRSRTSPRCSRRHFTELMKLLRLFHDWLGVVVEVPAKWISVLSRGTYRRSFCVQVSPFTSLPYAYEYGCPDCPMYTRLTSVGGL